MDEQGIATRSSVESGEEAFGRRLSAEHRLDKMAEVLRLETDQADPLGPSLLVHPVRETCETRVRSDGDGDANPLALQFA